MAQGKDRQIATVSRLRPRTVEAGAHRPLAATPSAGSNVVDLARARARRRTPGEFYSPPEGTAA